MGLPKEVWEWISSVGIGKGSVLTLGVQRTFRANQEVLFKSLGYSTVHSLDVANKESPTILHDLHTKLPSKFINSYDLIVDGGTMEHCFIPLNVLRNIIEALKVGGKIIHLNPFRGWRNHGYYSFTPKYYTSFYSINGFSTLQIKYFFTSLSKAKTGRRSVIGAVGQKQVQVKEIMIPYMVSDKKIKPIPLSKIIESWK